MKEELLVKIDKLDKKVDKLGVDLGSKIDKAEKSLTERIDRIGHQVANLEDDTPTTDEFDELALRVKNVEQKVSSI